MRFRKYFMCHNCETHLTRNPQEIYNYINISYCPQCGERFVEDTEEAERKYVHAVISSLVISAEDFDDLIVSIQNCLNQCDTEILINDNEQTYHINRWRSTMNQLKKEDYESIDTSFMDEPERRKIQGLVQSTEESDEQEDTGSFDFTNASDESQDGGKDEVEPTKHLIQDYLGICDVLFLGTGHDAPMLENLINEMEENYVDIVMMESGIGQSTIDKDASVGNKAAYLYDKMYDHADSYLLQGTPADLRDIATQNVHSSFSKEEGWTETDTEMFEEDKQAQRRINEEYYEAIIGERDGKFAMEAVGYIIDNQDSITGNACIIAGKSHISGIYRRMTGLEL